MSNSAAGAADPSNDNKLPSYSAGNHLALHRVVQAMLLLVGSAALIGLLLYNSAYPFQFLPGSYNRASESPPPVSFSSSFSSCLPIHKSFNFFLLFIFILFPNIFCWWRLAFLFSKRFFYQVFETAWSLNTIVAVFFLFLSFFFYWCEKYIN